MLEEKQEKYEESFLYRIRHSAAHVMAQAVLEMFPDGKFRSKMDSIMTLTYRAHSHLRI
jgi:threonyl-tRNA synthetase